MRNRPKRKSLRRKLIVISIASFLLALLGLFIIYYYITYVLQLPGTGAYQFANVLYAIQWVVSSTPWMLWFLIAFPLFIGIFYLLSRRTMKRLDRVSQAVQNVVEGDYHPELPEYNRDEIGKMCIRDRQSSPMTIAGTAFPTPSPSCPPRLAGTTRPELRTW